MELSRGCQALLARSALCQLSPSLPPHSQGECHSLPPCPTEWSPTTLLKLTIVPVGRSPLGRLPFHFQTPTMPPLFHLGKIAARAVQRGLTPRHGVSHLIRKNGPQAALVIGSIGGGVAVDTVSREIFKDKPLPLPSQEGEENASLQMEDHSWNIMKLTEVTETQETMDE